MMMVAIAVKAAATTTTVMGTATGMATATGITTVTGITTATGITTVAVASTIVKIVLTPARRNFGNVKTNAVPIHRRCINIIYWSRIANIVL